MSFGSVNYTIVISLNVRWIMTPRPCNEKNIMESVPGIHSSSHYFIKQVCDRLTFPEHEITGSCLGEISKMCVCMCGREGGGVVYVHFGFLVFSCHGPLFLVLFAVFFHFFIQTCASFKIHSWFGSIERTMVWQEWDRGSYAWNLLDDCPAFATKN